MRYLKKKKKKKKKRDVIIVVDLKMNGSCLVDISENSIMFLAFHDFLSIKHGITLARPFVSLMHESPLDRLFSQSSNNLISAKMLLTNLMYSVDGYPLATHPSLSPLFNYHYGSRHGQLKNIQLDSGAALIILRKP